MNRVERDQLIEEAAALPVGDPRRQELISRIDLPGAEGDAARREWAERSASYATIRQRLKEVVAPAGMVEQLLLIPEQASNPRNVANDVPSTSKFTGRQPTAVSRRRPWFYAAAALMMIAAVIAVLFVRAPSPHSPAGPGAFDELIALMVADHAERPTLGIESSDPREVERHLMKAKGEAPAMLVRVPDAPALGDDFHLQGGRLCKFDTRPIAYTRWHHQGIEHSLYQVEPNQFALPSAFERTEVVADDHRVVLWYEDGYGYGLVCPHQ